MEQSKPKFDSAIYLDETSQTGHEYMAIGGYIVSESLMPEPKKQLRAAKKHPDSELAWTSVRGRNLAVYKKRSMSFSLLSPRIRFDLIA